MTLDEAQWQGAYSPQCDPPLPPSETLPDMYDLPSEEVGEPGLPDEYHSLQPQLLSRTFRLNAYSPQEIFTGTDLNVYYDVRHPRRYKRPDWFAVVGISRLYKGVDLRMSYVRWYEGVDPFVAIEFLSPGTESEDLGPYYTIPSQTIGENQGGIQGETQEPRIDGNGQEPSQEPSVEMGALPGKWEVYEQILKIPYYLVFSRYTNQLRWFKLVGSRYQEQGLNSSNPLVWIENLELGLGMWEGVYEGISRLWLRWCDRDGNWIPTDTEQAEKFAAQETQRAEQAIASLHQVVQTLLQQGLDPQQIGQLTGLTIAELDQYRQL